MGCGMTKPCPTEPSAPQEEEGRLRGLISALPDLDTAKANRIVQTMQSASTERLKIAYLHKILDFNEAGALAIGLELSIRGVAPCFRDVPYDPWFQNNIDAECILTKCDIQWIALRYPEHLTPWQRTRGIFDPSKFSKTVKYMFWDGRRSAGYFSKALGLTDSQQRECRLIQCLYVSRWRASLMKRRPIMEERIAAAVHSGDNRDVASQAKTIRRRKDLWLCGEMSGWKPQRAADLYHMKTGIVLARNVVDNQLGKIRASCRSDHKCLPN